MREPQSVLPIFLAALWLVSAANAAEPADPQKTMQDYDERARWLIRLFENTTEFHRDPKFGLPQALGKLAAGGQQTADALEYGARVMEFRSPSDPVGEYPQVFTYPGLAQFLYIFGDRLSAEQRERLRSGLATLAKDLLDHGTENHAIMRIAGGYLFAQYFPGETWFDKPGGRTLTSEQLMAECKALLLKRGQGFYRVGNNEMLSTTYAVVNIYPLLNLYDFARDPAVRSAAEGLILYHLAQLALNDFEGHVMPPFNRQNAPQSRTAAPEQGKSRYRPIAQQLLWLYWGQNEMTAEDFTAASEPAYMIFFALSSWRPPAALDRIAAGAQAPYRIRSSIPFFGYWGNAKADETLRTVWRHKHYAIGGGAQRFEPGGFYLSYSMFQIAWSSPDRFNYLECSQPYWRSNHGEEEWSKGATTPFQQMAINKNSAIVLFDIPEKDPWPNVGDKRWLKERDRQYGKLLQVGQCRFPKSVDEFLQEADWWFLREGDVYLGIRPLLPGSILRDDLRGDMADFYEIKSYAARTGFIFETGARQMFGSFSAFREKLRQNPLEVDWERMEASYTDSDGSRTTLRYRTALEAVSGVVSLLPEVRIDGERVDFESWPVIESGPVRLENRILRISEGGETVTVNWQAEEPVISRSRRESESGSAAGHGRE